MSLNYNVVKNWAIPDVRQDYGYKETILYNLGVGAGVVDSPESVNLDLVWEKQAVAIPTIVSVLATRDPDWIYDPKSTVTWRSMLHGEESTEWHAPIPPVGSVASRSVVEDIYDKGQGRGAILVLRRELYDNVGGRLLATLRSTLLLRADGGFGGKAPPRHAATRVAPPSRPADVALDLRTRPEQALIYRLSGDCYPLHVSPEFARSAGYPRPILHGLATYGIAARAIVQLLCEGGQTRLARLDARFTAPVYPGETLRTEIWKISRDEAIFRCVVGERVVLNQGFAAMTS